MNTFNSFFSAGLKRNWRMYRISVKASGKKVIAHVHFHERIIKFRMFSMRFLQVAPQQLNCLEFSGKGWERESTFFFQNSASDFDEWCKISVARIKEHGRERKTSIIFEYIIMNISTLNRGFRMHGLSSAVCGLHSPGNRKSSHYVLKWDSIACLLQRNMCK